MKKAEFYQMLSETHDVLPGFQHGVKHPFGNNDNFTGPGIGFLYNSLNHF